MNTLAHADEPAIPGLEKMPDFLTARDLVSLGLYSNKSSVFSAVKYKNAPDYVRIGERSIVFLKQSVLDFVRTRMKPGGK